MAFSQNGETTIRESNFDLTKYPVWNEVDTDNKNRIIQAAKLYLIKGNPQTEKWIEKDIPYRPADAGFRALNLITQFEPEFIQNLDKEIWLKWTPTIYFFESFYKFDIITDKTPLL